MQARSCQEAARGSPAPRRTIRRGHGLHATPHAVGELPCAQWPVLTQSFSQRLLMHARGSQHLLRS